MPSRADAEPVVLITGGSRGIGAATAVLAARKGYAVAVNYTSNAAAAEAVARQAIALGRRAITVQADIAQEDQVLAMYRQIDQELGRVGALVNNAGITEPASRLDGIQVQRMRRMLDVNVLGTMLCAREAVLRMSTVHGGAGGAIVNVSSLAARMGGSGRHVDYAASKGAVESFTVGLARELAAEGIRVNAVRPGMVRTEIHASYGRPERVAEVAAQVPMQRAGTPDEVAGAILWLLGSEASYVTGSVLEVGGGR